jgi:hypothetical protein
MRALTVRVAPLAAILSLAACGGPVGSCLFTTDAGYDYCEDFLGTELSSSVAQNTCTGPGNADLGLPVGTYSSEACSTAGSLGTCAIGSGTADDYRYTYTPAGGARPSAITVESACGVAGGTFTAP